MPSRVFKLCPLLIVGLGLASSVGTAQPVSNATVLVHAGQLLDRPGQPARGASTVVIRNGKVESVRDGFANAAEFPGARVIDLRDKFVLPGLIDSHVHLDSDKAGQEGFLESLTNSQAYFAYEAAVNARKTLEAGFTTVRNLGNADGITLALRDAIADGKVPGPRIIDSGNGISATSGHGDWSLGLNPQIAGHMHQENLCDGADDCRRRRRRPGRHALLPRLC